jgi:hypothetical protein
MQFNQKLSWSSIRLKAKIEQKMMKESKDLPICPLPVELKPEFLPCCAWRLPLPDVAGLTVFPGVAVVVALTLHSKRSTSLISFSRPSDMRKTKL